MSAAVADVLDKAADILSRHPFATTRPAPTLALLMSAQTTGDLQRAHHALITALGITTWDRALGNTAVEAWQWTPGRTEAEVISTLRAVAASERAA